MEEKLRTYQITKTNVNHSETLTKDIDFYILNDPIGVHNYSIQACWKFYFLFA